MADEETPIDGAMASANDLVSALPNVHDWLSSLLGINLPHLPPLPQTIKNFDKAMGRLILAAGESFSSRIENNTVVRKEKSIALQAAVKASAKGFVGKIKDGDTQYERSIEYTFGENILNQKNRENVARLAFQEMGDEPQNGAADASESISDDWLNTFSDIVGKKSNDDIQRLWAKILAGEIRKPGTFRLKSLLSMAAIDSADAIQINQLLAKSINSDFIFKKDEDEDLSPYMNAESLDVLTVGGGMLIKRFKLQINVPVYFVIGSIIIFASSPTAREMTIPVYKLTRFGAELCGISSYHSVDELYVQSLVGKLKAEGMNVTRSLILARTPENVSYTNPIPC